MTAVWLFDGQQLLSCSSHDASGQEQEGSPRRRCSPGGQQGVGGAWLVRGEGWTLQTPPLSGVPGPAARPERLRPPRTDDRSSIILTINRVLS